MPAVGPPGSKRCRNSRPVLSLPRANPPAVADDQVLTQRTVGETTVHLYQVIHEAGRFPRDWVVIDLGEDTVTIATLDFEERRTLTDAEFSNGAFTPLTEGGVPVWGY